MSLKNKAIVFDLDDTLYPEIDYLKSAYRFIAEKLGETDGKLYNDMVEKYLNNENVFDYLEFTYDINKSQLLEWYRNHNPNISLYPHVNDFLNSFKYDFKFAIITDGRLTTQRNKIKALGLESLIDAIVISEEIGSEKPNLANFNKAMELLKCDTYCYIGDNTKKDFITPKSMKWLTICLNDQGYNIHKQDFSLPLEFLPNLRFNDWKQIKNHFIHGFNH